MLIAIRKGFTMATKRQTGNGKGGSSWIAAKSRLAIYERDTYNCVHCGEIVIPGYWAGWDGTKTPGTISPDMAVLDHVIFPDYRNHKGYPAHFVVTSCWTCNAQNRRARLQNPNIEKALSKPVSTCRCDGCRLAKKVLQGKRALTFFYPG